MLHDVKGRFLNTVKFSIIAKDALVQLRRKQNDAYWNQILPPASLFVSETG